MVIYVRDVKWHDHSIVFIFHRLMTITCVSFVARQLNSGTVEAL
jgi:hypothetical protein